MKTLLVLEEEPLVMNRLRLILKEYSLVEATSAEQAIRLFNDHAGQIDLLLAGVTPPASAGIQVALRIRSQVPELPVMLTSACPMSGWSGRDAADLEKLGSRSVVVLTRAAWTHSTVSMHLPSLPCTYPSRDRQGAAPLNRFSASR